MVVLEEAGGAVELDGEVDGSTSLTGEALVGVDMMLLDTTEVADPCEGAALLELEMVGGC